MEQRRKRLYFVVDVMEKAELEKMWEKNLKNTDLKLHQHLGLN